MLGVTSLVVSSLPQPCPERKKGRGLSLLLLALLLLACQEQAAPTPAGEQVVLRKIRPAPEPAPAVSLPAPTGPVVPVLQDAREPRLLASSPDGAYLLYLEAPDSHELLVWDVKAESVRARVATGAFKPVSAGADRERWHVLNQEGRIASLPLRSGLLSPPLPAPCPGARVSQEGDTMPLLLSTHCVARLHEGEWQGHTFPAEYAAVAATSQGETVVVAGRTAQGGLELLLWRGGTAQRESPAVEDERIQLTETAQPGFLHVWPGLEGRIYLAAQGAGLLELSLSPASTPSAGGASGGPPQENPAPSAGKTTAVAGTPAAADPGTPLSGARKLPLEAQVRDVWVNGARDELWTLEGPHLIRRTLTGQEVERSLWTTGKDAERAHFLRLLPTPGLLLLEDAADARNETVGAAAPTLLALQPWQRLRLLAPLPRLYPCGVAWLPEAGLAALALLEPGNDVLTTYLLMVGGSGGPPVQRLKVGMDPFPKGTQVPSSCQVIVSSDERLIGIAAGTSIKLYDRVAKERAGHARPGPVVGMAFSPDGGSLVYALTGGEVFRTEVPALEDPVPLTRYEGGIDTFVSAVDSDALAIVARLGDGSRRLELFAAERRQVLGGIRLEGPVTALSWAAGALKVAVMEKGGKARWWTPPGPRFAPLGIPDAAILKVSEDATSLMGAGEQVYRWNSGKGGGLVKAPLSEVAIQADGRARGGCVAILDRAGKLQIYGQEGGSLRAHLELLVLPENQWAMRLGGESSGAPEALRAVEKEGAERVVGGNFSLDGTIPVTLKSVCRG